MCVNRTAAWAVCDSCGFVVCRTCVASDIKSNPLNDVRCMNCLAKWSLEEISRNTTALFMNGEFRRIRQKLLLMREQTMIAPLYAAELSCNREISRIMGESEVVDQKMVIIRGRLMEMPNIHDQAHRWLRKCRAKKNAEACGYCTSCNGLLIKGRPFYASPVIEHCASCKRTGKSQQRQLRFDQKCRYCEEDVSAAWLLPNDDTTPCSPFIIGYCCGIPAVARLQIYKDVKKAFDTEGGDVKKEWVWASTDETNAAAAELKKPVQEDGDAKLRRYRFHKAPSHIYIDPPSDGTFKAFPERTPSSWGAGLNGLHQSWTSDATGAYIRGRISNALLEAGLEPETVRGLLRIEAKAPHLDSSFYQEQEYSTGHLSILEPLVQRELCDVNGQTPRIAALGPGSIAIVHTDDLHRKYSLGHRYGSMPELCNCDICVKLVFISLSSALLIESLRHLNNETSRAEYEANMARYSGLAYAMRENTIAVSVYTKLFERVVLPFTNDQVTTDECVSTLVVAHREVVAFTRETTAYYAL